VSHASALQIYSTVEFCVTLLSRLSFTNATGELTASPARLQVRLLTASRTTFANTDIG
jgi:hypothetical protein